MMVAVFRRFRIRWLTVFFVLLSIVAVPQAAVTEQPDFEIGRVEYPNAEAIVLRLEQHWTLDRFGKMHRREHSWIKLLDRRAIGRYADPRIDWNYRTDDVIIHTARTHLPDGTILPVPDYSFNVAAPSDVAGWPEWAQWRQTVVSFSGVQEGAVLELDYEVITQQGAKPWISADLRLNEDDPTVERIVTLTVPDSTSVSYRLDNLDDASTPPREIVGDDGSITRRWSFRDLAAAPGELQSPPWQVRCGRLRFTTCPGTDAWVDSYHRPVKKAHRPDPRVAAFAEEAVGDAPSPREMIENITAKLRASFNIVSSWKTTQSRQARRTPYILAANYGSPLEAAALLIAMSRDAGFDASPAVAVDARYWNPKVPTDSAFETVVARIDTPDGTIIAHPRQGIIEDPGEWGRHLLLWSEDDQLASRYVRARGESIESRIDCTGRVRLAADGSATAELDLTLTGLFFDPQQLDSNDAQRSRARRVVERILSGFEIESVSVVTLSDETFGVELELTSGGALPTVGDGHLLTLGEGPAILDRVSLPLARSTRSTDVELRGRCAERIDLTIVLPEQAEVLALPRSLGEVTGPYGAIELDVSVDDSKVRWSREILIAEPRIAASEFDAVRDAVRRLLADGSRHLLWRSSAD